MKIIYSPSFLYLGLILLLSFGCQRMHSMRMKAIIQPTQKGLISALCFLSTSIISPSISTAALEIPTELSSKILNKYRINDQIEKDENFADTNQVLLLLPIVQIDSELNNIKKLLTNEKSLSLSKLNDVLNILKDNKYDTKEFKRIFNRYSDNIFYSDPQRANLYLQGGANPSSLQTQKYLYRNQILTSINFCKDDIISLLKEIQSDNSNSNNNNDIDLTESLKQSLLDTIDDLDEGIQALKSYLDLSDKDSVSAAKDMIRSNIDILSNKK